MRPLPLLLLLAACQPALVRSVRALHANGDYVEATDVLLKARAAGDPRAADMLDAVVVDAYRMELDRAEQHEADDDLPASLAAYDRVLGLEARVVAAGGPALPEHVRKDRLAVARRTAILYASQGNIAFDEGELDRALERWTLAETTAPGETDAGRRIPDALTALGDQAREAHRYREAIARYEEAARAGGGERPRTWAAAIHAGYGRYALKMGACRRAVQELTAASALPFDVRLGDDLEQARACATREVVIHPFQDLVEEGLPGHRLDVLLVDQMAHHVRTHGSGFIRLLDPASKPAKTAPERPRQRFDVEGHLTRLQVEQPAPATSERTTAGRLLVPCQAGGEPKCEEAVTVAFTLQESTLNVGISGSVKVVDRASGEQIALRPLDMRLDKVRRVATPTRVTDARGFVVQAQVGERATDRTVGVVGDAKAWFNDAPALPDPELVLREAVLRLAAEAAEAVLAAVDREPDLPEPEALTLVTPVTSAEEITFGDAPLRSTGFAEPDEPTDDEGTDEPPDEGATEGGPDTEGDEPAGAVPVE